MAKSTKPRKKMNAGTAQAAPAAAANAKAAAAKRPSPAQFIQQTRAEIAKIVWPTRRETLTTTVMVLIMAAIAALFFSLVDLGIGSGLRAILSLAG